LVTRVRGREAWRYSERCTLCGGTIRSDEEVYVVGIDVLHEECLRRLLEYPEGRFREVLAQFSSSTRRELEEMRRAAAAAPAPARPEVATVTQGRSTGETGPAIAGATPGPTTTTGPPDAGELGRGERRALWKLARSVVDEALRAAGLRYVGEMRVDGMAPEPYSRFIFAIRDRVSAMLREPRRLELRVSTYARGYADTDVYVDGEYIYTWRPPEPYVGAFWNWVHRVYNLLRTLAERGLLKDEVLARLRSGNPDRGGALDRILREVPRELPEVAPCRSS
jgi:hypothetical protein